MTGGPPLRFSWDGRPLAGRAGDSVAAALAANGIRALGESRSGRMRGVFCGMGVCSECLVRVAGSGPVAACMTELRAGMRIRPHRDRDRLPPAAPAPAWPEATELCADAAIVGGGPAGLSAGLALARAGHSVQLLDERSEPGGQYYKGRSGGYRGGGAPDRQQREGAALRRRVAGSGISLHSGATVWFARREAAGEGFLLRAAQGGTRLAIRARVVLLATGAREVPALVPGWTLPGAMTLGAAQTLARRYGVLPGRRILVAGQGPLGLQLADELSALGGEVVACAERSTLADPLALLRCCCHDPRLSASGLVHRWRLLRRRIPFRPGWELTAIHGRSAVAGASLRRLTDGRSLRVAVDAVCAGDGFAGQVELARLLGVPVRIDPDSGETVLLRERSGGTAAGGVWVIGDAGGLGGAQLAREQGRQAGAAAAGFLAGRLADAGGAATATERFQRALWTLYRAPRRAPPAAEAEHLLCRCEEVSVAAVVAAIGDGASDIGDIKRRTRLGMGRCQGRYCTAPALRLLAERRKRAEGCLESAQLAAPQLPARPVPVAAIARARPEWKGHAHTRLTRRPARQTPAPLARATADLAVIGAGITGILASLRAAEAGADVVCVDRGAILGEASGGNAGSLHLQLLSWDYGARNVFADAPLRTLPLQRDGIRAWIELEREAGGGFGIALTGGMMVAENGRERESLAAKLREERRVGIDSEWVDGDEVRRRVPHASGRILGAAFCPGEGRIDPLRAAAALLARARQAGAVFETHAGVEAVERQGEGYRLVTGRGALRAGRVLIAAGGWSGAVARLFGSAAPVHGAPIQMVVSETTAPMVPCLMAHAGRHITLKQTDSGNLVIGGAWPGAADAAGGAQVRLPSLEGNLAVAAGMVPAVAGLAILRSWAAMNIDIDGAPLLGLLPGQHRVALAAAANGYTLAPLLGPAAARLVLTRPRRPAMGRVRLRPLTTAPRARRITRRPATLRRPGKVAAPKGGQGDEGRKRLLLKEALNAPESYMLQRKNVNPSPAIIVAAMRHDWCPRAHGGRRCAGRAVSRLRLPGWRRRGCRGRPGRGRRRRGSAGRPRCDRRRAATPRPASRFSPGHRRSRPGPPGESRGSPAVARDRPAGRAGPGGPAGRRPARRRRPRAPAFPAPAPAPAPGRARAASRPVPGG